MREVVIQSWCDVCAAEGKETAGSPFDLSWGDKQFAVDLCADHAKPVHEVERILTAHGQPIRPKGKPYPITRGRKPPIVERSASGLWECPECGKPCSSAQGLGAHRRSHGRRGKEKA